MKNKELIVITIYLIIMFIAGFGFGWIIYGEKYIEQRNINTNIFKAYEELRNSYDELDIKNNNCMQEG